MTVSSVVRRLRVPAGNSAPLTLELVRPTVQAKVVPSGFPGRVRTLVLMDLLTAAGSTLILQDRLVTAAMPLLWITIMAGVRGYEYRLAQPYRDDARKVVRAGIVFVIVGDLLSATPLLPAPRPDVLTVVVLTAVLALVPRGAIHVWSTRKTATHRVVVAGHRGEVMQVLKGLQRARSHGLTVAGVCVFLDGEVPDFDVPVTLGMDGLAQAAAEHRADAVIVLPCSHLDASVLRRLGWELESSGTQLFVFSGLFDVAKARTTVSTAGSIQLLHIRATELGGPRRLVKDIWERTAAATALLLLSPLLLVLAVAIRWESSGPAIFKQTRVGLRDRPFTIFKFRTMFVGADEHLLELAVLNEADGALFKVHADPRTTRLGRILRRYSLDELPQLVNVVLGQMSLVGPRPPLPSEVEKYEYDIRRKLAVKPGLTGLWQVSGRSDLSWDDSVRLDLMYVDNWSLTLDLQIVMKTVRAVLTHAGAY
ncbi:MAG: epsL [Marmoricola sp.]|nr:epsL [Marmoricola sp.]